MVGWQVILRADTERVLAPRAADRRRLAALTLDVGEPFGLFAFGFPDSHHHSGLECDRETAGRFAQALSVSFRAELKVPMAPASFWPINDLRHKYKLLGYLVKQEQHHGADIDPFREGTSLPDLLGLRPRGLYLAKRVREGLPRVDREELLRHWGIPALTEAVEISQLAEAGAASVMAATIRERTRAAGDARVACAYAAKDLGSAAIAEALGITQRAVERLLLKKPKPALERAVKLQMGLRKAHPARTDPSFVAELGASGFWLLQ